MKTMVSSFPARASGRSLSRAIGHCGALSITAGGHRILVFVVSILVTITQLSAAQPQSVMQRAMDIVARAAQRPGEPASSNPMPFVGVGPHVAGLEELEAELPAMQANLEKWFLRSSVLSGAKFAAARKLLIAAEQKTLIARAAATVNPIRWSRQVGQSYSQRQFLATNYQHHSTQRSAIAASIRAPSLATNIKSTAMAWRHPLAIAGYVLAPIAIEGHRQLAEEGSFDGEKLAKAVDPVPLAGAFTGAVAGDLTGATVQSLCGMAGGPAGHLLGFVARPMFTFSGYYLGSNFGQTVKAGKPSMTTALADTMTAINPAQFVSSVVCASIAGPIGQAIIPIPVVGYIAGYALGGAIGTSVGTLLARKGPLVAVNSAAVEWLQRTATAIKDD